MCQALCGMLETMPRLSAVRTYEVYKNNFYRREDSFIPVDIYVMPVCARTGLDPIH